ncbi:thiamine pyrophosphate-binding protein [Rhodobacteraceae bacterium RKSG542]|uniref:thiamine pyrophosphate-binding protein n=1 Tax=Pseudovibrio flavus TaxID=2529854 RepID=UPI0012BC746A|nr:thiamine pyrophosphate-binding protein [Pseudovibrio flavus]
MRGADLIARKLAKAGARYAFGIPGGEVLALMDGLDKAGLSFTLCKHENSGGFMAEGAWHAMRRKGQDGPVVLLATLGPGVANAVNVVANALQDKVPLIFLSGCVDGSTAQTYTHQVFDHQALLKPIVKASLKAEKGALNAVMDKAIAIAMEGEPGPVHIDVPISVAEGSTEEPLRSCAIGTQSTFVPAGPALESARTLLAESQRPVAIAGVEAVNGEAGQEITEFCHKFGIPLITSYKGKGLLDERDPLSLGGAGLSPRADSILLPLLDEADLVLLLGYDPIEMRINWRNPWPADKPVIEVTPVPRHHSMHSVTHQLIGDVALTIGALGEGIAAPQAPWPEQQLAQIKERLADTFAIKEESWGPAAIVHGLREAMPPTCVVTADSGAHRIMASQIWQCYEPRTFLQSSALCTMACALPLGAGYKMVDRDTPTLVFVGDAGLEMGLGELAVLRDKKLPVIICVFVDTSLALIQLKQRANQLENLGVDFEGTDFVSIANAYGGHGVWVDDAKSLAKEASAALDRDTFTLLACRIPRGAYSGRL